MYNLNYMHHKWYSIGGFIEVYVAYSVCVFSAYLFSAFPRIVLYVKVFSSELDKSLSGLTVVMWMFGPRKLQKILIKL